MSAWLPPNSRRREVALGLVTALALAIVLHNTVQSRGGERGLSLFQTHDHGLLVQFTVYPDSPPTIEDASRIGAARITPLTPGSNTVQLEDKHGKVLYKRFFAATFYRLTDPPTMVDSVPIVVVLPDLAKTQRVVVSTPAGSGTKEVMR